MAANDVLVVKNRLLRDAKESCEGGHKILVREGNPDATSLRAAASQLRQAAMFLDQLDGVLQAEYNMKLVAKG